MSEPLHSPLWYRVAGLRPGLRKHLRVVRQVYRGEPWYVIHDPASGRNWRFSAGAERVIRLMDGSRSVEEIWSDCGRMGDEMPTQDEIVRLLAQLHQADALNVEVGPDVRELLARQVQHRARNRLLRFGNPLAFRTRLFDPDAFLSRTAKYVRPLFGKWGAVAWLFVVACGLLLAAMHWRELGASVADIVLSPRSLLVGLAVYVPIKAVHELAHAYAVKVRGGEVHEIGVNWLVTVPVPYVDASAAAAFPEKRARMLVSAAGILAEIFIASLAMVVWAAAEPGVVRATAYYITLIAGASTVLFNGNPLLRYDGYYFLADLLEIPNLASRANAQLGYLLRRCVFGLQKPPSVAARGAEARWLEIYGVAAFAFRLVVLAMIVAMVAAWSKPLAIGLGVWWVAAQVVRPAVHAVRRLVHDSLAESMRGRALMGGVAALLLVVVLLSTRVPLTTSAEGVMWLPENGEIRAGTDGMLGEWLAEPGSAVRADQLLAELDDPTVRVALAAADSEVRSAEARYLAARATDAVDAASMLAQLRRAQAEYEAALERSESRSVLSPSDGVFVVANPKDLTGRYFHQGDVIGYVVPPGHGTVLAIVSQDDIGLIRAGVGDVQVRLSDNPAQVHKASIARLTPAGDFDLPSAALGTTGGGSSPVAPDDASGRRTLTRVFRVELELEQPFARLGGRAFVRFDHGSEPLAQRGYRRLRQLLLRHLDA